jgi:ORF6N domain
LHFVRELVKKSPMDIYQIKNSILEIRGIKVILDFELAKLYEVETRVLKQAVRRSIERFPSDFMFQLTEIEMQHLVSQNVIPTLNHFGGAKPFAFTEQGIAMLSSVLKSKKAIHMNISIMRAFVMMRQWAITLIADFDTHASAYYSACFNSWWTECPEGVYRRPTIKN